MTKSEAIMVARRPEWTKGEWTGRDYVRQIRAERRQYMCDEAPYRVESVHPRRSRRGYFWTDKHFYLWSLAAAKRRALIERKYGGRRATIYDNQTDKEIV